MFGDVAAEERRRGKVRERETCLCVRGGMGGIGDEGRLEKMEI